MVELTINNENLQRLTDADIKVLEANNLPATLAALDLNVAKTSDTGNFFHTCHTCSD